MTNMKSMISSLGGRQNSDESEDSNDGKGIALMGTKPVEKEDIQRYSYQFGWMNNKKFIKQLQKDNIDLAVLQSEIGSVNNKRRQKTWKERLLHVLRSNVVQIILCALVLIDAVIVIAEIILEIKAITSEKQELQDSFTEAAVFLNKTFLPFLTEHKLTLPTFTDKLVNSPIFAEKLSSSVSTIVFRLSANLSVSCQTKPESLPAASRNRRSLSPPKDISSSSPNYNTSIFASNYSESDYSHAKMLHHVSGILHFVSIGILGLFVLEVGLKILCLGRNFVREKFEIVDAVVIMISFVADIVFVKVDSNEVSVMVLFLLWRIVRVINGLMMHEKQRDEFRIQLQKRARRMSEMKCDSLETERDLQEKHIIFLEELCKEAGASEEQITNCKPRYVNISKRQSSNALKSMAAMSAGIFGGIAGAQHRRTLNIFKDNNNPSTPTTSRQSSALDTIAEDLAADNRSSQSDPTTPPILANGKSPAIQSILRSTSIPNSKDEKDNKDPAVPTPTESLTSKDEQQPITTVIPNSNSPTITRKQKQTSFHLKRQFYIDDAPDDSSESLTTSQVNSSSTQDHTVSFDYSQATENTGGFYSDSETDDDPWELRRKMLEETRMMSSI